MSLDRSLFSFLLFTNSAKDGIGGKFVLKELSIGISHGIVSVIAFSESSLPVSSFAQGSEAGSGVRGCSASKKTLGDEEASISRSRFIRSTELVVFNHLIVLATLE